jgi:hypothetical protein
MYNIATDLPDRVEPIRPNEKQPFSGGEIVSNLRIGIPIDFGSTGIIYNNNKIFYFYRLR